MMILAIIFNLAMIFITGGWWLLILVIWFMLKMVAK